MSLPQSRKLEWEAELRMLMREAASRDRRIEELKEILAIMFPKGSVNG